MTTALEELRVLQLAESVADAVWKQIMLWDVFARDVVGSQLARAADSIGANIAEAFGRFNYGEKVQFLYYARGSLFETKYWLNRAKARELVSLDLVHVFADRLTDLARQLNMFVNSLKRQRYDESLVKKSRKVREFSASYMVADTNDRSSQLFTDRDLEWLAAVSNL